MIWKLLLRHLESKRQEAADVDAELDIELYSSDYKTTDGRTFRMRIDIDSGDLLRILAKV